MKKTFHANGTPKQAGVTTLVSTKAYFKPKLVRKDKEGHFILIKRRSHRKDIQM
jgi:hypothetical protein